MYEFLVLSLLMTGPMHGYGIRQVMNRTMGPYRTVAWGPLYTTLRKLQESVLIELTPNDEPVRDVSDCHGGPPSKRYRITERGRARFLELMRVPREPEAEYDFTFGHKLARLGHVSPTERLALLRDYEGYCRAHVAHLTHWGCHVATGSNVPEVDRSWIVLAMERKRLLWETDANWVAQLIHALQTRGQGDEGEPEGVVERQTATEKEGSSR